jgi:glutamate synthase domain-containing protein 2
MRKMVNFIAGSLLLLNLYGCVAVIAGAAGGTGTAAWLSGKLVQQVNAPSESSIKAVKETLRSMNLEIYSEVKVKDVTQIRSHYTDGRKIWIDIRSVGQTTSTLEVRVGAFGDKTVSAELLKQINSYL